MAAYPESSTYSAAEPERPSQASRPTTKTLAGSWNSFERAPFLAITAGRPDVKIRKDTL